MNVCKIHLVIQTQLVITQKDLTCVYVILVTLVTDSHVTVRKHYDKLRQLAIWDEFFHGQMIHTHVLFRDK